MNHNLTHETIRIGTIAIGGANTPEYIRQILPHGFESFSLMCWEGGIDWPDLAARVREVLGDSGAVISSLGVFGNPLKYDEEGEMFRRLWADAIENAHQFGCDIVAGFTGRVPGVAIPDNMPRFTEVFTPLAQLAQDNSVRLAFENCDMGGNWHTGDYNIAHTPAAWELMFNAVPYDNLGLEWEPCHQLVKLIDPMPQLRKWVGKIFHVHGKDATIYRDVVREHGIGGSHQFAYHRTPGFGDSNWADIISELRRGGFRGSIDIEGWHDPVYKDALEMTGQVRGLHYLKQCRGGHFVPNPQV